MAKARRGCWWDLGQRGLHGLALVLLTALVLLQTVGVLHRVVHAHGMHHLAAAEDETAATPTRDHMGGLQRLWGDHSHAVDCQLFDHSCPDVLYTPALMLMPVLFAPHWQTATWQEHFALFERFYAARGPPV